MGYSGTNLRDLPKLNILHVKSEVHGDIVLDVNDFIRIRGSYEEEMRNHPSNLFYINALKDDVTVDLKLLETEFIVWQAELRSYAIKEARELYGKQEPTVADIESILATKQNWEDYHEKIAELEGTCKILGDLAQALAHKKNMLEQLAQHERYQLSQYSDK